MRVRAGCRISKVKDKQTGKEVIIAPTFEYKTDEDLIQFVRGLFDVLAGEDALSIAVAIELKDNYSVTSYRCLEEGSRLKLTTIMDALKSRIVDDYNYG